MTTPHSSRPLRVLQVIAMLHSGGAERWVVDLCDVGRKQNMEMDIVILQQQEREGLFARRARELQIPVHFCPGRENPLRFVANLRKLIREHGPFDAVHSQVHTYSGFVLLAAWLEGVPGRIAHSHNVLTQAPTLARKAYISLSRTLIRRLATAALAPALDAMVSLMGEDWQRDARWKVMRCGINLEPFRKQIPAAVNRASFGIPEDALVLGTVGRLCAEKNSEFIVGVLGEMLRRGANAYLLMLGEGPLRETLEVKATQGGFRERLILAGVRSDVPDVLRAVVDVFSLPSPPPPRGNEALPLVVVEAQACGLRTVISDGVTTESIVLPELVVRIPEAAGIPAWADTILQHAVRKSDAPGNALQRMENSEFNCVHNLRMLDRMYRGLPPESVTLQPEA